MKELESKHEALLKEIEQLRQQNQELLRQKLWASQEKPPAESAREQKNR